MRILLFLLVIGSLLPQFAGGSELSLEFQSQLQELGKPLLDLDEAYRKRLRVLEESARGAGKLDEVLMLQKEIEEIAVEAPSSFASFAELRSLRTTYDEERRKREEARGKEIEKVKADFETQFRAKIEALTKAGQIEEAVTVREEWERLVSLVPESSEEKIPSNAEELIAYLTGTIWSWDDRRAKFTADKTIHGLAAEEDVITWRPYSYEVTDELTIRYGRWEVRFNSTFTELETRNIHKEDDEGSTVYGKLLGTDEGK